MSRIKLVPVACPICGCRKNYTVLYPKNFILSNFNTTVFSARRQPDKIHCQLVTCNRCHLVRSTPIVEDTILSNLYKKSRLTYENELTNLTSTYLHALQPVLTKLPLSAHILEIGCGNGFVLKALSDRGYTNVYGVEPSSHAIALAHTSIRKKIKQSTLVPGLFKKETFDCIVFFQTLDHVADPNAFLRLCRGFLKHGGVIMAFNHNIDSLSATILGEKSPIIDIEHTFLYSPKTLSLLFEKNGFCVDTVFSPAHYVSLRHIVWLSPIPKGVKKYLLSKKLPMLDTVITVQLGNICLQGHKT